MAKDFRIAVGFLDHWKTVKLKRILGFDGIESLLRLWEFAAQFHTKGILEGMDVDEIEIAAKWGGARGTFVDTLWDNRIRFIDKIGENYCLHDWEEHQGFIFYSQERQKQAKKAIAKRYAGKQDSTDSSTDGILTVEKIATDSTTPLPSPSPSPSPEEVKDASIKTGETPLLDPVFITLILKDGTEYPILENVVDKLQTEFPTVDVKKSFRDIKIYQLRNEDKRWLKPRVIIGYNVWLEKNAKDGINYIPPKAPEIPDAAYTHKSVPDLTEEDKAALLKKRM